MAKTISVSAKTAKVIYQEGEESCPGEPALLVEVYSDTVSITQDTECININVQTIPELIKQLRAIQQG